MSKSQSSPEKKSNPDPKGEPKAAYASEQEKHPKAQKRVPEPKHEPTQQTTRGTLEKFHSAPKSQKQRKSQKTERGPKNNPKWRPLP